MTTKRRKRKSLGKANQKARQRRSSGRPWLNMIPGVPLFTERAGKTEKLDILPYVVSDIKHHPDVDDIPEDIWFRFPYKLHRNIGPNKKSVICPSTWGKDCPICQAYRDIWDDPDLSEKESKKMSKGLKASARGVYAVRPVAGKYEGQIMVWDVSDFCFLEQLDIELDDGEEEWNGFADLEGGYTLKIRFTKEELGTNSFAKANRIDFEEREDLPESILDEVPCLDKLIKPVPYERVQAIFEGTDDEEPEEPKGKKVKRGTKSAKSAKSTQAKKAPKPAPEPEEEDDNADDPEFTWVDLLDMDLDELEDLAVETEIDADTDDPDELRKAIADELGIEVPKPKKQKKAPAKAKSKKGGKGKKGKNKTTVKNPCPFMHEFGADFEETDDCDEDDCKKYNECFERYEELQE